MYVTSAGLKSFERAMCEDRLHFDWLTVSDPGNMQLCLIIKQEIGKTNAICVILIKCIIPLVRSFICADCHLNHNVE